MVGTGSNCFWFLAFHNKRHPPRRNTKLKDSVFRRTYHNKRDVTIYKNRITILYFVFRPTIPHMEGTGYTVPTGKTVKKEKGPIFSVSSDSVVFSLSLFSQ